MNKINVVMLVGNGQSSNFMFNALKNDFNIQAVFMDDAVSKKVLLKRRIKNLGLLKVLGQILFILFSKWLGITSANKINSLQKELSLDGFSIPSSLIKFHGNLNSEVAIEQLKTLAPDIVVVNGTRILSEKLLNAVHVKFLNTHVGITPKYRGVHGGYWAMASKDKEHCGVTVHIVDKGIDTGGILYQDIIEVDEEDNFFTYPIKQLYKAIPLMKKAINDCNCNKIDIKQQNIESKLWYHPTIVDYIYNRLFKGVK
jgi:folate-dependent phosphoribosylglycinamide formyltransferase PurN